MARYFVTPHARDGLREVVSYVEQHFGDSIAQQVLDRLLGAFATLAESPSLGHRREDITRDERVRFWSVGPSLIAYRRQGKDTIEILFVERGERDWERLWEDAE